MGLIILFFLFLIELILSLFESRIRYSRRWGLRGWMTRASQLYIDVFFFFLSTDLPTDFILFHSENQYPKVLITSLSITL